MLHASKPHDRESPKQIWSFYQIAKKYPTPVCKYGELEGCPDSYPNPPSPINLISKRYSQWGNNIDDNLIQPHFGEKKKRTPKSPSSWAEINIFPVIVIAGTTWLYLCEKQRSFNFSDNKPPLFVSQFPLFFFFLFFSFRLSRFSDLEAITLAMGATTLVRWF